MFNYAINDFGVVGVLFYFFLN